MARIAGDSKTYATRVTIEVGTRAESGLFTSKHARVVDLDLVSTSTVSKMLDKGDALTTWAFNIGLEGVEFLSLAGKSVKGMSLDDLKVALGEIGYTPFSKRGKASDRGNVAHDILESLGHGVHLEQVKKKLAFMNLDDEVRGYCRAGIKWWEENQPITPILVEEPIGAITGVGLDGRPVGFMGTLDLLADRHFGTAEVSILTDYKTAKAVYPEHVIQLSGYDLACRYWGYEPVAASVVLLREDETWEEKFVEINHASFLAALALWKPYEDIKLELNPPAICVTCGGRSQRKVLQRNEGNCAKCGPLKKKEGAA